MASLKELFHAYANGKTAEEMQALFNESSPLVLQVFYSHLLNERSEEDVEKNRLISALEEMRLLTSTIHAALSAPRLRR